MAWPNLSRGRLNSPTRALCPVPFPFLKKPRKTTSLFTWKSDDKAKKTKPLTTPHVDIDKKKVEECNKLQTIDAAFIITRIISCNHTCTK